MEKKREKEKREGSDRREGWRECKGKWRERMERKIREERGEERKAEEKGKKHEAKRRGDNKGGWWEKEQKE